MAVTDATFHDTAEGAVAVACNDLPWHGIGRVGIRLRDMSFCDPTRGLNLSVAIGVTGAGGFSPRHRHTFEQIRYYIDGPTKFGLAAFNDVGPAIRFVEAAAGATIGAATEPFTEVRVLIRGSARYDGRTYDGQSCFFFPANAASAPTEIVADAQFLCVRFGEAAA